MMKNETYRYYYFEAIYDNDGKKRTKNIRVRACNKSDAKEKALLEARPSLSFSSEKVKLKYIRYETDFSDCD
jgi:hypothetical protein